MRQKEAHVVSNREIREAAEKYGFRVSDTGIPGEFEVFGDGETYVVDEGGAYRLSSEGSVERVPTETVALDLDLFPHQWAEDWAPDQGGFWECGNCGELRAPRDPRPTTLCL